MVRSKKNTQSNKLKLQEPDYSGPQSCVYFYSPKIHLFPFILEQVILKFLVVLTRYAELLK